MDYGLLAALVALVVVLVKATSAERKINLLGTRLAMVERRLDATAGPVGSAPPGLDTAELTALIREGRKIQAIKLYRDRAGVGLAEAKAAVERLERGQDP